MDFDAAFQELTGNPPFPWQRALYQRLVEGCPPEACRIPTGLGKTSVIPVWLVALVANVSNVPRRLVYVVNRRTVVDQATNEAETIRERLGRNELKKVRERLQTYCAFRDETPLAISTLRGQFADNREWSADPSRPAIILGTVDMIGSRLLFSGYGIGFKSKPLHAGFLGQDALLVHDEAHLEPAFQKLLVGIKKEQERCKEFHRFHVMELSATSRGTGTFGLTDEDRAVPEIRKRIEARKAIELHQNDDEKSLPDRLVELALEHEDANRAVLIFARTVETVGKVAERLRKTANGRVKTLTGTIRGKERDELVHTDVFRRFLPQPIAGEETVYLVCTSAGEVGINISSDDLVCDLSTFESMAQRFGRVNRFGLRHDTRIDIVYPKEFDAGDDYELRLERTLGLLRELDGNGSPAALEELDPEQRRAAFSPGPALLPVSDILFDAWSLTTIRGKLQGRPTVEPYLHGISAWEPPETHVAWREEVWELRLKFVNGEERDRREPEERRQLASFAAGLLEDYPLKPHELLRDNSGRVFDRLKKLKAPGSTLVWLVSNDDTVEVTTLAELVDAGKETIETKIVLLPPNAGGLANGMLADNPEPADDVADELIDGKGNRRRVRVWVDDEDEDTAVETEGMRLVRRIDLTDDDQDGAGRSWRWFERPSAGDTDGSTSNNKPVLWRVHTDDVTNNAIAYVGKLPLPQELKDAIVYAARWHDLGKQRKLFQTMLGNSMFPARVLAKSGKKGGRVPELYRHEFGSLVDVMDANQPHHPEFLQLTADMQDMVLHLIAVHHGFGRPHFPADRAFDPEPKGQCLEEIATAVAQRFARLQRRYGRWGLAYLESILRAADYAASADPSSTVETMS
jgi:CRISPR-associated endonuclease/helicase Cas3